MARSIPQQHADGVVPCIGDDKIRDAVAVHISHGDRTGTAAYREGGLRAERTVGIPQQYPHIPAEGVGHNDVGMPIVIYVGYGYKPGVFADRVSCRRVKRPIAYSQQNINMTLKIAADYRKVGYAVAVEVPRSFPSNRCLNDGL
jgi:hypothetical protein